MRAQSGLSRKMISASKHTIAEEKKFRSLKIFVEIRFLTLMFLLQK